MFLLLSAGALLMSVALCHLGAMVEASPTPAVGPTAAECDGIRQRTRAWLPRTEQAYSDADHIRDGIWLGNVCAAADLAWLKRERITTVLNTALEWDAWTQNRTTQGITFLSMALDDETNLDRAATQRHFKVAAKVLVKKALAGERVLVHCNMGISRSTSVVLRYLQMRHGWSYREALDFVKRRRPVATPNTLFEDLLQNEL